MPVVQWYERGYQAAVEAGARPELQQQLEDALVDSIQVQALSCNCT